MLPKVTVQYKKLLNVKYRLMKAKQIEISILLRSGFKKTEISKQLNVNRMTVHRVERMINPLKSLKDRHRLGRPQIICQ